MADVQKMIKTVTQEGVIILSNILSESTGEYLTYIETTKFMDGSTIDDAKTLSASGLYRKIDGKYYVESSFLKTGVVSITTLGYIKEESDSTEVIKKAFNLLGYIKTLVFPKNVYTISEEININNKQDFTIVFEGATIIDKGLDIKVENGNDSNIPFGIVFTNCKNVVIKDLTYQNSTFTGYMLYPSDTSKRRPSLGFKDCTNITIDSFIGKGLVGPYVHTIDGLESFTKASFIWIYGCKEVNLLNVEFAKGSGNGEMINIVDSDTIKVINLKHDQAGDVQTFWSILNIINSSNALVENLNVISNSPGSLMDIIGKNITVRNCNVDYPNGKFIDISQEWGDLGGDIDNILVENIITNGIPTVSGSPEGSQLVDNICFDNAVHSSDTGFIIARFNKTTFNNLKLFGKSSAYTIVGNTEYTNVYKEVYLNIPKIELTKQFLLPAYGKLEINGGEFIKVDVSGFPELRLVDYKALTNSESDLRNSDSFISFNNTIFKGIEISLGANIIFNNCIFEDCLFSSNSMLYTNQTIKFIDCNINMVTKSIPNDEYFRLLNTSPYYIDIINSKLYTHIVPTNGKGIFHNLSTNGSIVNIDNSILSFNYFMYILGVDSKFTLNINNSKINQSSGYIVTIPADSVAPTGNIKIKLTANECNTELVRLTGTPLEGGILSKIDINVIGNNLNKGLSSSLMLNQAYFKSFNSQLYLEPVTGTLSVVSPYTAASPRWVDKRLSVGALTSPVSTPATTEVTVADFNKLRTRFEELVTKLSTNIIKPTIP